MLAQDKYQAVTNEIEEIQEVGGGFTDILDLIINGGDLKSIIGLADTLYQTIGGFLEQRAKDVPDYLEVIRGEVKAEKRVWENC